MSFKVPPIVVIAALGIAGYVAYTQLAPKGNQSQNQPAPYANSGNTNAGSQIPGSANPLPNYPTAQNGAAATNPFSVTIQGSTSMVAIFRELGLNAPQGSKVYWTATSSDKGIAAVQSGAIQLAGVSRTLTLDELQGQPRLGATTVATDEIAVMVGVSNQFSGNLTRQQVADIFAGRITNWSQIGGANKPIRVINRPEASGTRHFFANTIFPGGSFAQNAETMAVDETTGIIRKLGDDGISYATYSQVVTQKASAKSVSIDGAAPGTRDRNYVLARKLVFVYQVDNTSKAVQDFLAFATSPAGQRIVQNAGFAPAQ